MKNGYKILFLIIVLAFVGCNNNGKNDSTILSNYQILHPKNDSAYAGKYPAEVVTVDKINDFFEHGTDYTIKWLCEHSYKEDSNDVIGDSELEIRNSYDKYNWHKIAYATDSNFISLVFNDSNQVKFIQSAFKDTAFGFSLTAKDLKKTGFKFILGFEVMEGPEKDYENKDRYFEVVEVKPHFGYVYASYYKADYNLEKWIKENVKDKYIDK